MLIPQKQDRAIISSSQLLHGEGSNQLKDEASLGDRPTDREKILARPTSKRRVPTKIHREFNSIRKCTTRFKAEWRHAPPAIFLFQEEPCRWPVKSGKAGISEVWSGVESPARLAPVQSHTAVPEITGLSRQQTELACHHISELILRGLEFGVLNRCLHFHSLHGTAPNS